MILKPSEINASKITHAQDTLLEVLLISSSKASSSINNNG